MKSVSKIVFVTLFLASLAHATVFNVDCTATYTKDGISNSAREHGTITFDHDIGSPKMMLPMIDVMGQAPYYAHAQFNVRPTGTSSDWRLWFTKKPAGEPTKDWSAELSLVDLNKAALEDAPSPTEKLSFSCSFGRANTGFENDEAAESESLVSSAALEEEARSTPKANLKFDHFGVIREFGTTDTGALFGILPNTSGLEITGITGPKFLGDAHVGTLTQSVLSKFFNNSANPMTESEKRGLLEKYQGSTVIYFEGYPQGICNGKAYEVVAKGKLEGIATRTTFRFAARANQTGDCDFIVTSFMTSY